MQWNPSKTDTVRTDESVLNSEVSSVGVMEHTNVSFGAEKGVLCLWRCPQFRGVHMEGSHCIYYLMAFIDCVNDLHCCVCARGLQ